MSDKFDFCEFLRRADHYVALVRPIGDDKSTSAHRDPAARADECECVHCPCLCNATDEVPSINADQHPTDKRRVVQVDLTRPVFTTPVREPVDCCCDVNGFAFDERHHLKGLAVPSDELGKTFEGLERFIYYVRNVKWSLASLYALYTDAVLESFAEGFAKRGVYVFHHRDYVHRFFDLFSHELPALISTLECVQNELPPFIEQLNGLAHVSTSLIREQIDNRIAEHNRNLADRLQEMAEKWNDEV